MGLLRTISRGLALAVALAACFRPNELDGALHCDEQGGCPDGFDCVEGLCWNVEPPRTDAAPPDDAMHPADAEPDAFVPACSNGIDDDCDGKIDRGGGDTGCSSGSDNDERGSKKCDDGIDNDLDGYTDFGVCGGQGDPQCDKPDDDNES